ncbi:MAG: cytochrome P450 [Bacteroidota bacterium]|nr:cytochrome P450 [Bacteroidota bacterium]
MLATTRAVLARYAPPFAKSLVRRAWQRLRGLRRAAPRHLFVFGGRTEYWPGAGRELFAREPAFRAAILECERITTQVLSGPSLLRQFAGEPDPGFLADERRVMHTSTVMQLALVDLWCAHGVEPEAVLGVSLGEIAAVYAAGGLSLLDALRVSACYYTISEVAEAEYAVLVVGAGFAACTQLVASGPAGMFVVLVLDAGCCFVFCTQAQVVAAQAHLAAHGTSCIRLQTAPMPPYHVIGLAQHIDRLRLPLRGLQPRPTTRPAYLSTVGRLVPAGTVLGADYWLALCQYPVNVHGALTAALADGYRLLTPIGTHPFPYFQGPQAPNRLGEARLLGGLQEGGDEQALFESIRWELKQARVVMRPAGPATATEFARQLRFRHLDVIADPYPGFAFLRRHGALHQLAPGEGWLVTDSDMVADILRQPLLFSSNTLSEFDTELLGADPPIHTANRAIFQPFFSPRELSSLSDYSARMVQELGAALPRRASFDFVTDFAIPLTQAVGGRLLGLDPAELEKLQNCLPGHTYELNYFAELTQYFEDYFNHRQAPAEPPVLLDNLLAHVRDGSISQPAAVSLAKTMWLAGIATSSILMASAAHYLLTHPATMAQLQAQPELVDAFVEETLRLQPPLISISRVTTASVTLGGNELPAGTTLVLSIGAVNRDPARFPNPDELDLSRRPTRHHSFGGGIHACMGAHLARQEARLMVHWLVAQGPALRLATPFALPQYYPHPVFRAQAHLYLTLQPPLPA